MASHQCCANAPTLNPSSGRGTVVDDLGGLRAYTAGSPDSGRAVLLVSDVYGFEAPNLRKIADKVAAAGFFVVVSDFLYGDLFVPENAERPFQVWLKDHSPEKGYECAKQVIAALKHKGISTIGAGGFCWGAKVVTELAKSGDIQTGVLLHPSLVTVDDFKAVKCHIAILGAQNDHLSPPELVKQFEEVLSSNSQDFQTLLPGCTTRQDISRSGVLWLKSSDLVDPWRCKNLVSEYDQLSPPVSAVNKPVFIDAQDALPDSAFFSFGVAEQCIRHEKILQFLLSGSSILEGKGESLNISLVSDPTGLHTLAIDICQCPRVRVIHDFFLYESENDRLWPSLIYPQMEFYTPKPVLDCIEDLSCTSTVSTPPDGRVLFTGTEAEIRDLLSMVSEFYLSKNLISSGKRQMVVPYFTRSGNGARANNRTMNVDVQTVAPMKRPAPVKLKPLPKKKESRKTGNERDPYRRNYSYACERLISVILNKSRDKTALLSLKKSGPEISHLLTHFSAGIAGAGLAVLFSVTWKITNGKVPFSATKLLSTGFAFGLVWLSAAVNRLRGDLLSISRSSRKPKWTEDEVERKVEESVNHIFFRAMTLMAMVVLRFA